MVRNGFIAAAAAMCLGAPAVAQPVEQFDATRPSMEIANLLAQQNIDAAVMVAARLMPGATAEKLKDAFQLVRGFGQSQYTDLVYARDYGRTTKDLIYKIDYDKAFMYVRFLYHVDHGGWQLVRIDLKKENDLPFPKDWTHIYPR
jgi:hypothetical protein